MEIFGDVIFLNGIERIICCLGGIFFGFLGYKLFLNGLDKGFSRLNAESKFIKIVFSGSGPGLFFMAFGSIILLISLFTGKVSKKESSNFGEKYIVHERGIFSPQQIPQLRIVSGEPIKIDSIEACIPTGEISFAEFSIDDGEIIDINVYRASPLVKNYLIHTISTWQYNLDVTTFRGRIKLKIDWFARLISIDILEGSFLNRNMPFELHQLILAGNEFETLVNVVREVE